MFDYILSVSAGQYIMGLVIETLAYAAPHVGLKIDPAAMGQWRRSCRCRRTCRPAPTCTWTSGWTIVRHAHCRVFLTTPPAVPQTPAG